MRHRRAGVPTAGALTAAAVTAICLSAAAQVPLDPAARELRVHAATAALDRYLETWNSRDPRRWATSLHFPHVRPGPGAFELSRTPEQYAAGINYEQTIKTGWHHSEWTSRRVLQVGSKTVHVAGSWMRYTADDRALIGSDITYIVTSQNGRWGVLSRFAAGQSGAAASVRDRNGTAARAAVDGYFRAMNTHDPDALSAAIYYPHVTIADGAVELSETRERWLSASGPGQQRTWYETRVDAADAVQVTANGANFAVVLSRRDRQGTVLSSYEAMVLVVSRAEGWKVQAISVITE